MEICFQFLFVCFLYSYANLTSLYTTIIKMLLHAEIDSIQIYLDSICHSIKIVPDTLTYHNTILVLLFTTMTDIESNWSNLYILSN